MSERDLVRLEEYLDSGRAPEGTMSLSALDGFLAALAAGPKLSGAKDWRSIIWGGAEPFFESIEEMGAILRAIGKHCEDVVRAVRDGTYRAILDIDIDDKPLPFAWAAGFMAAVSAFTNDWQPLLDAEPERALLLPILALCGGEDDAIMDLPLDVEAQLIDNSPTIFPSCVDKIAAYWHGELQNDAHATPSEQAAPAAGVKIGRNALCPCGSGSKYKKCCGRTA